MSPNWAKTQEEENGVHVACQRGRALVYPVTSSFGACMQLGPSVTAIDLPACLPACPSHRRRSDGCSLSNRVIRGIGWMDRWFAPSGSTHICTHHERTWKSSKCCSEMSLMQSPPCGVYIYPLMDRHAIDQVIGRSHRPSIETIVVEPDLNFKWKIFISLPARYIESAEVLSPRQAAPNGINSRSINF